MNTNKLQVIESDRITSTCINKVYFPHYRNHSSIHSSIERYMYSTHIIGNTAPYTAP